MDAAATTTVTSSPRRTELLEAAYSYVLEHGLADLSLRPLAAAIGSSPRVLILLFGSKDGLVRAVLDRARTEEVAALRRLKDLEGPGVDLASAVARLWAWLASDEHRPVLRLWVDSYARSLRDPDGPWSGYARASVSEWLALLETVQPDPTSPAAQAARTLALSTLRGAVLDLLATGDRSRIDAAVRQLAAHQSA